MSDEAEDILDLEAFAREHGGVAAFLEAEETLDGDQAFEGAVLAIKRGTDNGNGLMSFHLSVPGSERTVVFLVRSQDFAKALGESEIIEGEDP